MKCVRLVSGNCDLPRSIPSCGAIIPYLSRGSKAVGGYHMYNRKLIVRLLHPRLTILAVISLQGHHTTMAIANSDVADMSVRVIGAVVLLRLLGLS